MHAYIYIYIYIHIVLKHMYTYIYIYIHTYNTAFKDLRPTSAEKQWRIEISRNTHAWNQLCLCFGIRSRFGVSRS